MKLRQKIRDRLVIQIPGDEFDTATQAQACEINKYLGSYWQCTNQDFDLKTKNTFSASRGLGHIILSGQQAPLSSTREAKPTLWRASVLCFFEDGELSSIGRPLSMTNVAIKDYFRNSSFLHGEKMLIYSDAERLIAQIYRDLQWA